MQDKPTLAETLSNMIVRSFDDGSISNEIKPIVRNLNTPCPECGNRRLYTDVYDKCYNCGRGVCQKEFRSE